MSDTKPNISILDIETFPHTVLRYDLRDTRPVYDDMIVRPGGILCFAVKRLDEDDTYFYSLRSEGERGLQRKFWEWLDWSDGIISYFGKRFDLPRIKTQLIQGGWNPPSPWTDIDLCKVVQREFDFPSSKLGYVVKALGVGEKFSSGGIATTIGCMNNDSDSWKQMETYCRQDVDVLQPLYHRVKPWMRGAANLNVAAYCDEFICTVCGTDDIQRRGTVTLSAGVYQRYRCNDCGHWMRGSKRISGSDIRNLT